MKDSRPRERQSVWCCGKNYQRWRFVGREFPGTHHETCVACGQELVWPETRAYLSADFKAASRKKTFREAYHRRAEKFRAQRLTAHGSRRRRAPSISDLERAWGNFRAGLGEIKIPEVQCARLRGDE